jgi:hypothetical protein
LKITVAIDPPAADLLYQLSYSDFLEKSSSGRTRTYDPAVNPPAADLLYQTWRESILCQCRI